MKTESRLHVSTSEYGLMRGLHLRRFGGLLGALILGVMVCLWPAGTPCLGQAPIPLLPAADQKPEWKALAGLPDTGDDYVFAGAGNVLVVASMVPGEPRLWTVDMNQPVPVFRELAFLPWLLASRWHWPAEITSLTALESNNEVQVYAGTSGGIMKVAPADANDALWPFWDWDWDTSAGLRRAGNGLVWSVRSFGSESGLHTWDPVSKFDTLHWTDRRSEGNRIVSASTGTLFGWSDMRGFIWYGADPPLVLLEPEGYSLNGGHVWTGYLDVSGNPLRATRAEAYGLGRIFLVLHSNGQLVLGGAGQPFRPINCPAISPTTIFFEEHTRLLIVGTKSTLFFTHLQP